MFKVEPMTEIEGFSKAKVFKQIACLQGSLQSPPDNGTLHSQKADIEDCSGRLIQYLDDRKF